MRRSLVVLLSVLIAFSGFAQEDGDWYQGKPIKDIVFDGLRHVSAAELDGIMASFIGRPFSDEVFMEVQGRLYALEYFDVINPRAVPADASGNEVIIRFNVTERPIISRITFVGNSHLRRSELLGAIAIKINDVANQVKIRVDEQAIISKYLEKGYPDITVRSESQADGDASIIVTFFISEGEKISIKEFHFEGNSTFSERALRAQLSLKAKNLVNNGGFQEAKLAADREALVQYYHDRGYIDAELTDVVRNIARDEKGNNNMSITFKIYEGRIYNFGGITFDGNQIFPTEQLAKLVYSKTGDTVNARKVEADLQRVMDLYYDDGYIFNSFAREENEADKRNGIISYKINIVERGRAHIENIIVRGNEKTKTDVILKEIPLEPGGVFSKAKVYDAMRNLYNLQYFSAVAPDTPQGSADGLMDLVFDVDEQPTTDIQFGLTFSGISDPEASLPVSGMFKLTDRNLRGSGNSLGAEVNLALDTQSVSLNYNHRRFFGLPLSGGIDFTFQHTERLAAMQNNDFHFNGDEKYAFPAGFISYDEYKKASKLPPNDFLMKYNQLYWSLGLSTGYRWATFLGNLSVGGGIRTGLILNIYDAELYTPFDPTLRDDNNRPYPVNSVWASVALDQRDISYDPSKGYYGVQRFSLYGILPMEHEKYFRSDTKLEYFHTLLNIPVTDTWSFKAVFGIHSGLSFIWPTTKDEIHISDTSKLAVDGMFTGRGWTDEYRNKGLTLWENWAEIRFPVVPGIFAFDLFFDAAGVESTQGDYFNSFSIDNMRFSLGGGIRFTIPQFPFRLSIAKRFKTVNNGRDVEWQKGAIGGDDSSNSGVDFVLSFVMSSY